MIRSIWRWTQHLLVLTGLGIWLVVATPVADYLAQPLRLAAELKPAQAIIVLGGGAYADDVPSASSMARAVYGFTLLRKGYAPRLVLAGGRARPHTGMEGPAMKKLLEEIGAASKQLETEERSTRTYSNAAESAQILHPQRVKRILLVTHPNHMLRAELTFEKAGFIVYPAPVPWERLSARNFELRFGRIPLLQNIVYEYGGLVLYWWRGWL